MCQQTETPALNKYAEFINTVNNTSASFNWRYGQTIMNVLFSMDKDLYDKILATDTDCYYDDSKTQQTLNVLRTEWAKNANL